MSRLRLDTWSDVACPWCYVGKRRLELALERFAERAAVDLYWRSFELDPSAREADATYDHDEWLARKYRMPVEVARRRTAQLCEMARVDGLELRFDRLRPGNTFDAHRLLHLARETGRQGPLKERLLRAYFSEGEPIGQREVLLRLAVEVGLDSAEVSSALESGRFGDAVRNDERQAAELGIQGVPFFVIGERYAISGAQPPELLLTALERAFSELEPLSYPEGAVCEPESC